MAAERIRKMARKGRLEDIDIENAHLNAGKGSQDEGHLEVGEWRRMRRLAMLWSVGHLDSSRHASLTRMTFMERLHPHVTPTPIR